MSRQMFLKAGGPRRRALPIATNAAVMVLGLTLMTSFLASPLAAHAAAPALTVARHGGCVLSDVATGARLRLYRSCDGPAPVVFWPALSADAASYATPLAPSLCRVAVTLQHAAAVGLASMNTGAAADMIPPAPVPGCTAAQMASTPVVWGIPVRAHRAARVHRTGGRVSAARATAHRPRGHHAAETLNLPAYTPVSAQSSTPADAGSILLLAGKFALVLLLLFVCLRVLRAVMPRLSSGAASGPMLLHSESIGAKQQVRILDLGVRLVVVGVTGTAMTALTTIDDEEEMAALRVRYGKNALRAAVPERPPMPDQKEYVGRETPPGSAGVSPVPASTEEPRDMRSIDSGAGARTVPERPSFAQALAIATARSFGRDPSPRQLGAPASGKIAAPARHAQQSGEEAAPADTQAGDRALGHALEAIRSLHRKIDQE